MNLWMSPSSFILLRDPHPWGAVRLLWPQCLFRSWCWTWTLLSECVFQTAVVIRLQASEVRGLICGILPSMVWHYVQWALWGWPHFSFLLLLFSWFAWEADTNDVEPPFIMYSPELCHSTNEFSHFIIGACWTLWSCHFSCVLTLNVDKAHVWLCCTETSQKLLEKGWKG